FAGGHFDRSEVPMPFYAETSHRFARLCDLFGDAFGPFGLDADDYGSTDVRVAANTRKRPESQLKILAELQSAISVRQSHGPLYERGHAFSGGIGNVIDRQDNHVIANTKTAIGPTKAGELQVLRSNHMDHLRVLTL